MGLSSRRRYGSGGPNKIQDSEVFYYCEIEELEGQDRRDLLYVVSMLDNVWWDLIQKKSGSNDDSA